MEITDDKALKKFRELIRKQDKSARISFLPKQFFFGNHELPILPNTPIVISQHHKNRNRLILQMVVAKDEIVGYKQVSILVSFNQFEHIRLVEDKESIPPAIIFTLVPINCDRVLQHFPGLKDKVEKSITGSHAPAKDMTFFLGTFRGPKGSGHFKYDYNDNGMAISRIIEFEQGKVVLMEDIAAVYNQHEDERVTDYKGGPTAQRENLFKEVDSKEFLTDLSARGIEENYPGGGRFAVNKSFRVKKPVPVNSEAYSKGHAVGIPVEKPHAQYVQECNRVEKVLRKRKIDEQFSKNLRWVNREGFVTFDVQDAQENQYPSDEAMQAQSYEVYMENHFGNGYGLLLHQPYSTVGDISAVTQGISQIGMTPQDWHMGEYGVVYQQFDPALYQFPAAGVYENTMDQGDHSSSTSPTEPSSSPRPAKQKSGDPEEIVFRNLNAGLTITMKDFKTLDRKEFVNDVVISFMADYIYNNIDEKLRAQVHIFSTYFYNSLSKKLPSLCFSGRKPINPDHEELVGIDRVIRWTKTFDVFKKDFILIPINEDLHWMLIAIINPGGALVDMSQEKKSRKASKCYMLFCDPLSGLDPSRSNHMCHIIKKWLAAVYKHYNVPGKKFDLGENIQYDGDRVEVLRPKNLPVQDNFYECGLYVLHYIEGLLYRPSGPVVAKEFPDLDWAEKWPEAEKMCDLMRDKVYNLLVHASDEDGRSRLAQFERVVRCGLSREKEARKARRHSAVPFRYTKRHPEYYARHYSLNPPAKNVMNDDPTFLNPRRMAAMPITQRVRSLRIPEENFPIAY